MSGATVSIRFLARLAVAAAVLIAPTLPGFAGGVAILNVVLSDNGDGDGYADTLEAVDMRLTVQNTSGVPLSDVSIQLINESPASACMTAASVSVGDLAPGEVKLTDAFVFYVGDVDRTTLGLGKHDPLSISFALSIGSEPDGQQAHPPRIVLDLDLDVANGSGPASFLEQFEESTLGKFEVDNIDAGKHSLAASDGYRCQYSDPDWVNGNPWNNPAADVCMLGNSVMHADATFWGLSGPVISPLGGRGFTGFHSMFFGIDQGPPDNWTTPVSVMEAAKTIDPIHLGWDGVSPLLSFMHQVSIVDFRTAALPDGLSYDRAIVMAQVAGDDGLPAASWLKLEPYENVYTTASSPNIFNCSFDPADDGNTEDDFFDPSDPDRRFGPSSTCFPELTYSHVGETSNPFDPANVGSVDGPGHVGIWGIGTWVESKFDLSRFRGRSVRLRYLYTAVQAGNEDLDHWEDVFSLGDDSGDDGWWIDDVTVSDTLSTPADVSKDDKDNSALPEPPGGDTDSDGLFDVCDNCALGINPDQSDVDQDGLGDVCDPCPVHPFVEDHDSDGLCAELDNCPFDSNPGQANGDGDPAGAACDCDDTDPTTYPGAEEVNDGVDNQCSGDAGFGVTDETSSESGFYNPDDKNEYSWPVQPGATRYQVVRGNTVDFSVGCTMFGPFTQTFLVDAEPVASGELRCYMNRSFHPNLGSWGQDSAAVERDVPCD
jgi:hypothetical protein